MIAAVFSWVSRCGTALQVRESAWPVSPQISVRRLIIARQIRCATI